jgi:hypothetical protein
MEGIKTYLIAFSTLVGALFSGADVDATLGAPELVAVGAVGVVLGRALKALFVALGKRADANA